MSRLTEILVVVLILLSIPRSVPGRLMEAASYQEMFDKADLIVIAKPLSTADTSEHTTLPGDFQVVGINTDFETHVVFKGDKSLKKFVLHHYRLESDVPIVNGPNLVDFDLSKPRAFLLFLIKEPDGRYAPASGQVDPRAFSVIKLDSVAE